jgi:hypothetical protein
VDNATCKCGSPVFSDGACITHHLRPFSQRELALKCRIEGCDGIAGVPGTARGLCTKCYQRERRNGDPTVVKRIFGDIDARFWSHVDRRGDDECWLWTASIDTGGYGTFGADRKVVKAHGWAYEHFIGPMPEGKPELDHDCHTRVRKTCLGGEADPHRRCVNFLQDVARPHLRPVTGKENSQLARTTKFQDEYILSLHARWVAGERAALLAVEADTPLQYLYRLFRNVTPYEPGSHRGTSRAPIAEPAIVSIPRALIAVTGPPQELPGLFDAAS